MTKQTLVQIEQTTRDLLEDILGDIEFIEPPINLGKILEHFDLKLAMAGFRDPKVAGAFDLDQKTIYLEKHEPKRRQFFTVAHELGHFVLKHKKKFNVFYRQQASEFNGTTTEEEREANYFAASLLMPRELVIRFWDTHHDFELLAAYFGVSRSAAFWRLKSLGIIPD